MTPVSARDFARGVAAAAAMFVVLGTVAALWSNPLFMRMTPTGGFEIALLLLQSALAGVYVGLPQSTCGKRSTMSRCASMWHSVALRFWRWLSGSSWLARSA